MPSLDIINRDLDDIEERPLLKTPTDIANQLRIMEEIGKSCRETPFSLTSSDGNKT